MALPELFRPSRGLRRRETESFLRPFEDMRRLMEDFWMTPFEEFGRLSELVRKSGAAEFRVAQNDDERARIWKGGKSAFSAVGRLSPDYLVQDGVVPRRRLGAALTR